jgi:hypothetical protein
MHRVSKTRRRGVDLLVRPALGDRGVDGDWSAWFVDPVAQLVELADLRRRELLSDEEYQRQRTKVLYGA